MQQQASAALETPLLFAPNVTPGTFMKTEESEPLDLPRCDSLLFPCPEDSALPRRSGHSKRKPEHHIPRPPNAFILFRSSFIRSQHVSAGVETDHSTLSKIIGLTWQNLPEKERQVWHEKARVAKEDHRRRFPGYTFRPNAKARNGKGGKRTVREVFPKDMKRCAKIAELLVNGKKGEALDFEMQEFDKHHKMEIVTKFEEPITAQQYARSSSAPAPERESESMESRPSKRARSDPTLLAFGGIHMHHPSASLAPPTLRLIIGDNCAPAVTGTASPSPADYESVGTPFSSYNGGFYSPSPLLDEELLGAVHPSFHSMTEPSTPEHLYSSTSFSHFDTWPACSSPCSEAPETPIQGLPIDPVLSLQQIHSSTTEYYDPTHFPSFDMPQPKTFAEVSHQDTNHYYETNNLISYSGQFSHNSNVSTDFDFSTFLPTVSYDSL